MKSVKSRIDSELKRFFSRERRQVRSRHYAVGAILDQIGEFTLRKGAKRIRGLLVVLGYRVKQTHTVTADIVKVAAAYEILHSYLLIHDDIIDEDVERRGKPTLHTQLQKLAPVGVSAERRTLIGRDLAIIAGDLASLLSDRLLDSARFSTAKKARIHSFLNEILFDTCNGQLLDILSLPQRPPSKNVQKWRYIQKTARYTIEAPFVIGAECAGNRTIPTRFYSYARHVGLGFQLADDIQNIFGSGLATRQSDIRAGKVTYLISYALQSRKHRPAIVRLLKKKARTAKDVAELRALLIASGGLHRALRDVHASYSRARSVIQSSSLNSDVIGQLVFLVDALALQLPRVGK